MKKILILLIIICLFGCSNNKTLLTEKYDELSESMKSFIDYESESLSGDFFEAKVICSKKHYIKSTDYYFLDLIFAPKYDTPYDIKLVYFTIDGVEDPMLWQINKELWDVYFKDPIINWSNIKYNEFVSRKIGVFIQNYNWNTLIPGPYYSEEEMIKALNKLQLHIKYDFKEDVIKLGKLSFSEITEKDIKTYSYIRKNINDCLTMDFSDYIPGLYD